MSNNTIYHWRIYCSTEQALIYDGRTWAESKPTTCPNDTAHTVDATRTDALQERNDGIVTVREETVATGGRFMQEGVEFTAAANTTSVHHHWVPSDISVLAISIAGDASMAGDVLNASINKNTTAGVLTAGLSPASAWTAQDYTVGQTVTYTHSNGIYGERVYTCILNTTTSQNPENGTYWRHGIELAVSSTVTANAAKLFEVKLVEGGNSDNLGRITFIDNDNNKIYVEGNPVNSYNATTTAVQLTVYVLRRRIIGSVPWNYQIGEDKIGGSHIPSDAIMYIEYENKHPTDAKTVNGCIDFLY